MKTKLILFSTLLSFSVFGADSSGTGGEPESSQSTSQCEYFIEADSSGTGGEESQSDENGYDKAYMIYMQCLSLEDS
jgi:hypothetical protein